MYVEKTVDKHEGNFDQVLIAGALSPYYVRVHLRVSEQEKKMKKKKMAWTVAVCLGIFNSCSPQHALMKQ